MKAQAVRYALDQVVPEHLQCPIGYTLMRDPVVMPGDSQHVFDRTSASTWLKRQRTNPMTRQQVPKGPLIEVPAVKKQVAGFLLHTARFHRAFGSPREAAARTIQAAWLKYKAEQPAHKKLMAALLSGLRYAQAQAAEAEVKLRPLDDIERRSAAYAQQAKDLVLRLNQVPDPDASPVNWVALAASPMRSGSHASMVGCLAWGSRRTHVRPVYGAWATQLREVIANPSVDRMRRLHDDYQAQTGGNFAHLLLAQHAAPLRAMLFVRGLRLLELCAQWVPRGRHGSLLMPGNRSGREFYVGEVNAAGERHGLGLRRDALQAWYGHWEHGVFSGLGGHTVMDTLRTEGAFVNDQANCGVSWYDDLSIHFKDVGNHTRWGIAFSPSATRVGVLSNHKPGLRSLEIFSGEVFAVESHVDDNGIVMGRCCMQSQTYWGRLSGAGLPHGPGQATYPNGWRMAAMWNQGVGQGVGLQTDPNGQQSLYAFDDAGGMTLRAATA